MNTYTILGIVLVALILGYAAGLSKEDPIERTLLSINGVEIQVEVANTPEERIAGLSRREAIGEKEGMFFVFNYQAFHAMWMKDMLFSLDFIWIDEDFRVVETKTNVSPDTYPEVIRPDNRGWYVLEVPAGFVEKHGIRRDDVVSVDLP